MANKDWGGPYVTMAGFYEPEALGPNGEMSKSAILVDKLPLIDGRVDKNVALILKMLPGANGYQPLNLRAELRRPDMVRFPLFEIRRGEALGSAERITTMAMRVKIKLEVAGIYLVSIYAFDNLVTRFPLEILDPK